MGVIQPLSGGYTRAPPCGNPSLRPLLVFPTEGNISACSLLVLTGGEPNPLACASVQRGAHLVPPPFA